MTFGQAHGGIVPIRSRHQNITVNLQTSPNPLPFCCSPFKVFCLAAFTSELNHGACRRDVTTRVTSGACLFNVSLKIVLRMSTSISVVWRAQAMSLLNLSLSIAFRFLEIISLFKVVTGFFMLMSQVSRKWSEIASSSTRWSFKKTLFSGTIT